MDTLTLDDSKAYSAVLSNAQSSLVSIPNTLAQDVNFITIMTIYLNYFNTGDSITVSIR
jgi:hypothetical protein